MATRDKGRTAVLGFTLVELIVVVLIIGVLSAFAVPAYMKSVENSKADDASALTAMVGTTNRMYALDHAGAFASGVIDSTCNGAACVGTGDPAPACDLVACKYLAAQDFNGKPYDLRAADGKVAAACLGGASAKNVSCVQRKSGAPPGTTNATYTGWGYNMTASGVLNNFGGAPAPVK